MSGLTAALTIAQESPGKKVVLLESSEAVGGRVQSDTTDNGYVLDRGFAVFIEKYPFSKKLLDYEDLGLSKFLPGALVRVKGGQHLERVADPLRQPEDLFTAMFANVGSLLDKIKILPLIVHVRTSTIEELFEEPERDTLSALKERWGFSDDIIEQFFRPFLEGIYLGPLEEQSSRMFSFVFKMFSEGAATLPAGGIGAVSKQLASKAEAAGVDIRVKNPVKRLVHKKGLYLVKAKTSLLADQVIVATDGPVAKALLASIKELRDLTTEPDQTQRSVGCLYYSFAGTEPVTDPILILNGAERGVDHPVNNICFPSAVSKSYVPQGLSLCSVTVLKPAMDAYEGQDGDLDRAVRKQLASWFPDCSDDILNSWKLERIYKIQKAQPAQLNGPLPANAKRACNVYRDVQLPDGLFVCGDHVATATLNGALESGVAAGKAAALATGR